MSVDLDEYAKQIAEQMERDVCEKGVPIFPTRFTIKEKHEKEAPSQLKHKYGTDIQKDLTHSSYTLRMLREGYVYLYDKTQGKKGLRVWKVLPDGQFQTLKILGRENIIDMASIVYGLDEGNYVNRGEITPYIIAPKESAEVYVSFSDTLWSAKISTDIINEEKFRKKLMTPINVTDWNEASASTDTFKMNEIDTLVEEYIDFMGWKNKFAWTSQDSKPKLYAVKKKLIDKMLNVPTCEGKIIGAMLYDNIGLVQDLGNLIVKFRNEFESYMKNEDRVHKKLISNFIELAYQQEVAKGQGKPYLEVYKKDKEAWQKIKDGSYREDYEDYFIPPDFFGKRLPSDKYAPYIQKQINPKTFKTDKEFENGLFGAYAPEKVKLINEEARQFFLKEYEEKSKALSKKIVEAKNDRCKHLNCFLEPTTPRHFGYSFLNYDQGYNLKTETCATKDKSVIFSTYMFSQSFGICVEGMMDEPKIVEGVINQEHELFTKFMNTKKSSTPIWDIFWWSQENKVDSLAAVIVGNDWTAIKGLILSKEAEKASRELQDHYNRVKKHKILLKKELQESIVQEKQLALEKNRSNEIAVKQEKSEAIERVKQQRVEVKAKLKKDNQELHNLKKEMDNPSNSKNYTKLQEQNRKLNYHSQKSMGRTITQYTLSLEDVHFSQRGKVFKQIEKLLAESESNFNLSIFDMFENDKSIHAKKGRVVKLEISQLLYDKTVMSHFIELDGGKAYADNRVFAPKADKAKKALETKRFVLIVVDEREEESLRAIIKELEEAYAKEISENENSYNIKKEELQQRKVRLEAEYQQTQEQIEITYEQKVKESLEKSEADLKSKLDALEQEMKTTLKEEKSGFRKALIEKKNSLKKSFSPWVGKLDTGAGGLILLATAVNLNYAIKAFKETNTEAEDWAARFNFVGAVTGILAATLQIKEKIAPNISKITLQVIPKGVPYKMVLGKVFAAKSSIVGFIAGIFDSITQLVNAYIQTTKNNDKAAMAYAWSGVLLFVGVVSGLAVAVAGSTLAIISLIVLSIVATVGGIYSLIIAQDLAWDSVDKWLSGCFFRMTEEFQQTDEDKYEDKTWAEGEDVVIYHEKVLLKKEYYLTEELDNQQQVKEIDGFLKAYSEPAIEVEWRGVIANAAIDTWHLVQGEHYPNKFEYKGEDGTMQQRATDNYGYAVEIKLNFPMLPVFDALRFGDNFNTDQKPVLSKRLEELSAFNIMVKIEKNEIIITYLHIASKYEQMHFAFSWNSSYQKEQKTFDVCYRIYDNDNFRKIK